MNWKTIVGILLIIGGLRHYYLNKEYLQENKAEMYGGFTVVALGFFLIYRGLNKKEGT